MGTRCECLCLLGVVDNVRTSTILGDGFFGLFWLLWRNHSTGAAGRFGRSYWCVFGLAQDDI